MSKKLVLVFCLISAGAIAQTKPIAKKKTAVKEEAKVEAIVQPDHKAEYVGGNDAMEKFIIANLKYPEVLKTDTTIKTKKVFLKFMIDKTGAVNEVSVMKGIKGCKACSEEAIKVVSSMPKWKPAIENNQSVDSWFNLPISFSKPNP